MNVPNPNCNTNPSTNPNPNLTNPILLTFLTLSVTCLYPAFS